MIYNINIKKWKGIEKYEKIRKFRRFKLMNITVPIILSILIFIFVLVLIKENILESIGKFLCGLPKLVKIILYIAFIISATYIIILEIMRFKV